MPGIPARIAVKKELLTVDPIMFVASNLYLIDSPVNAPANVNVCSKRLGLLAIVTASMLVEKAPLLPLSLNTAYDVTGQPPVLVGYVHLRVTVVAELANRVGACTL